MSKRLKNPVNDGRLLWRRMNDFERSAVDAYLELLRGRSSAGQSLHTLIIAMNHDRRTAGVPKDDPCDQAAQLRWLAEAGKRVAFPPGRPDGFNLGGQPLNTEGLVRIPCGKLSDRAMTPEVGGVVAGRKAAEVVAPGVSESVMKRASVKMFNTREEAMAYGQAAGGGKSGMVSARAIKAMNLAAAAARARHRLSGASEKKRKART